MNPILYALGQTWKSIARRRINKMTNGNKESIINEFHQLWYDSAMVGGTWSCCFWAGVQVFKNPLDLWIYQEILHRTKPDLIIETGTAHGGSALFMAHILDAIGKGEIITVDKEPVHNAPQHPRITYIWGGSTSRGAIDPIRVHADGKRTMVILDSDHSTTHVLAEMRLYGPLVTPGCYMVVEDTNVNGNPVHPLHGSGPKEAVDWYLRYHTDFTVDRELEKFLFTFNPGGYLQRKNDCETHPPKLRHLAGR